MNQVLLKGFLTKDPELRYTADGRPVASATVSVKRGESKDFIKIVAFGQTAEKMSLTMEKSDHVIVTGSIKTGSYERDGKKIYTTDIWIDEINKTSLSSKTVEYDGGDLPF